MSLKFFNGLLFSLFNTHTNYLCFRVKKMEGITGKRALVTGGGSGIGLGIANLLAENGATVYILSRDKQKLEKAASESENKLIPLQGDISDWSGTRKAVEEILPIQLLVNNAAVFSFQSTLEITENDYNHVMNINLKGAINFMQFIANDLISRNLNGRFVNISSVGSVRAKEGTILYACSKAALDMATKCFALELGPKNIRVNAVNPTLVRTDMTKDYIDDPKYADIINDSVKRIPYQGRIAKVEEMANATLFLLSDKSEMITGHCLLVDGGQSIS